MKETEISLQICSPSMYKPDSEAIGKRPTLHSKRYIRAEGTKEMLPPQLVMI